MEEIAWRYIQRGDLHSAVSLFDTLNRTFTLNARQESKISPRRASLLPSSASDGRYGRLSRLCRVLQDPLAVPLPHRYTDAVDAFLELKFPLPAYFGTNPDAYSKTVQRWLLILHPDKNPHPRAREAFQRLGELKGQLSDPNGALPEVMLPTRRQSTSDFRTPLPQVRNPLRAARENTRRQEQFSSLLSSLKGMSRRRLECDLSFSNFERSYEPDDKLATTTGHMDLSSVDLDTTIVANGISQSDCSYEIKKAASELLSSSTVDPLASTTGGIMDPRRIVLRRPPTLEEWRKDQGSPSPQVNVTIESRHVHKS